MKSWRQTYKKIQHTCKVSGRNDIFVLYAKKAMLSNKIFLNLVLAFFCIEDHKYRFVPILCKYVYIFSPIFLEMFYYLKKSIKSMWVHMAMWISDIEIAKRTYISEQREYLLLVYHHSSKIFFWAKKYWRTTLQNIS